MKYYTVWHGGHRILAVVKAQDKRQAVSRYIASYRKVYVSDRSTTAEIKSALTVTLVKFVGGVLSHGEMD